MPSHEHRGKSTGGGVSSRRVGVARALSKLGIASRTVAAQWVDDGRISLNGRVIRDPETPVVLGRDRLCLDGAAVEEAERRYVMLNKPRGLVTTARDERGRPTVYSRLGDPEARGLAPVGRLDKASEGLLLFSNDSEWAARLLDPAAHLAKVYHVQIDTRLDEALLARLCGGIRVENVGELRVGAARTLRGGEKNSWLEISLHEGRNRHIRRLLGALKIKVLRLVRVAIGPLKLGDLPKGQSRALTADELHAIAAALDQNKGGNTRAGIAR